MSSFKDQAQEILNLANIKINGDKPWDIKVHNDKFYPQVLSGGSLALGESYMSCWWDCEQLDEFFTKIFLAELDTKIQPWRLAPSYLKAKLLNHQRRSKAFEIGEAHYDLGNNLYECMLDKRMTYTCGYWKDASTLDEAQEAKLELVCKKVGLKKGMKVLDIGCGWGSFAKYAAEKYGANIVGITVSKEQMELARERCKGLPVEIRLQDYREVNEKFDCIVSLGMFEHVGYKNYRQYMEVVRRCLADNGLFLLHTIGGNKSVHSTDPWLNKYIFPNSMLPSIKQIGKSIEGLFVMEDWHNFGTDYDKTLMAWFNNFNAGWKKLQSKYNGGHLLCPPEYSEGHLYKNKCPSLYDERFYRMWKYYLLTCAGTFRSRKNQLWQIVLSKKGLKEGYSSIR